MKARTITILVAAGLAAALAARTLVPPPASDLGRATAGRADASASASEAAAPDAAGAGTATVRVYDDGQPVPGCEVVFQDEAGAVTSTLTTGRDGKASALARAHGMVTVAYGTSIKHLITVARVEPGDEVVVGEEEDEGGAEEAACTARVILPGAHPKAARHLVALGVGTTEVPDPRAALTTTVLDRFLVGGRFSLLAEAIGKEGAPLAFTFASVEGCRADGGAGAVEVRLPPWSTDYRTFTLDVTGPAEEGATVAGELFILGQDTDRLRRGRREAPLRDRTALQLRAPRPLGTHAAYELVVERPGAAARAVLVERRQVMPERIAIDLRERLLPRVEGAAVDASGSARPTVRWRVAEAAPGADAVVVRLSWPETKEHLWTLVLPPDHPSQVAMPALPDSLASWRPDGRPLTPAVALVDASFVDGFADLKKRGLVALEDPPKDADVTVLRYSASGPLRF